jgi:hypothetical protein
MILVRSDDPRTALRAALYSSDFAALMALLQGDWPTDALQLIGDGLGAAVQQKEPGASQLAERCVLALRDRDWEGDEDLAVHLEAVLGIAPTPMLRRLPVDLEELSLVLEGDPLSGDGRVDLRSGVVWSAPAIEYAQESGEDDEDAADDPERWLWINNQGSRAGYRDMVDFAATVTDPGRADRLEIALQGRGAFRRFKDVLARWPGELERWHGFSEDRKRGRARAWLAEEGYTTVPRRPS